VRTPGTEKRVDPCQTFMKDGTVKIVGIVPYTYRDTDTHKEHLDLAELEPIIQVDVTEAETIDATLFEVIFDYFRRAFKRERKVCIVARPGDVIARHLPELLEGFDFELKLS